MRALIATYLLLPQVPMLFMGEEWEATQPFPYFCDFHGELAEQVRQGRKDEFASFPEFQDPKKRDAIPDPLAEATFLSGKLNWREPGQGAHAEVLERYRSLLRVRREEVLPLLGSIEGNAGSFQVLGVSAVAVLWAATDGRVLRLYANLCEYEKDEFPETQGRILWHEGPQPEGKRFSPWTVRWALQDAA